MKAVVLAAGEGRRLQPLTNVRPKPMIPVANRPILGHVVEALVEAGIDDVVLVVGYKRDRIQTHFEDGDEWGIDITYAVQEKQLGTGHAVLQAEPHVDDAFLVLNGDRIVGSDLVRRMMDHGGDAMAVTRSEAPSDYGVVDLEGDRVESVVEKPPEHEATTDVVNAGLYALRPAIFDAIRETERSDAGEVEITAALERLIRNGGVDAVWSEGEMREDVSHLWDLLAVNAAVLDEASEDVGGRVHDAAVVSDRTALGRDAGVGANATVRAGSSIGDNVTVGANCVIANAVVMADAQIADGAVVRDCVVAENAHVGAGVTVEGGHGSVVVDGELYEDVRLGAVIGDNSHLAGGVSVEPGTVIGDDVRVAGGTHLAGEVPPGSDVRRG